MDYQIIVNFNSQQMVDAIEKNTGKIVNRTREDLLGLMVAIMQDGINGEDPKYFLGGVMLIGWEGLFELLPCNQDLFMDV